MPFLRNNLTLQIKIKMGKFLRFAIMFGPMLYKGAKKLMAKRNNQNPTPPPEPQNPKDSETH